MKRTLALLLAAAALPLGVAAVPPAEAQAVKDWTKVVAQTAEGGFRVGNPDAPVKLVEYGSLTCDHCAHFAEEAMPKLLGQYVKSGKVSFEFRNFVRDPADLTASLLSRCAGPDDFFALTHQYFTTQPQWFGKLQAMTEAEREAINALPPAERLVRFASMVGLDATAAKAGVSAAEAKQCLASEANIGQLVEMGKTAVEKHQIKGTPSFMINGKTLENVHNWAALEPHLKTGG
ncbi:thioredoxin domain-containing protein [Sphingosinicella humi]|uniref:Protein-disulfide isomerase n=1 Tax=Allosphingosinicella humi TaxID=2068657 RepID=A0A2U2J368_9SPHN|nr:thioredoxin domain-containing protein [Sphingosinicella humi]PWG02780.1 protein-disulfide isomerase [Sphingosinicella humi]